MAHLRIIALSILIAVVTTGCGAALLSPPLRYSASLTTSVSTYEREPEAEEEAEEAVDDHEEREERVVVRKRSCNPCRRRVYVTPYYYYYPYIQVY
jgi:hypothetical protein